MKMLIINLFLFSAFACAMGGKAYKPKPRKEQDKLWRACEDFEHKEPIGKLCNRTCVKRKGSKCKKWKTTIKDFSKKDDFLFFRNGAFIFIDEDQVL